MDKMLLPNIWKNHLIDENNVSFKVAEHAVFTLSNFKIFSNVKDILQNSIIINQKHLISEVMYIYCKIGPRHKKSDVMSIYDVIWN